MKPFEIARPAPADGRTIYNDHDYFLQQARGSAEAGNNMPFVVNPQSLIGLSPQQQMNQFYPAAWQDEGVQKTIGPNGQNIGPELQKQFGNSQAIDTAGGQDWPSLVRLLSDSGRIDAGQAQALLGLATPKKLDASMNMTAGLGQALLGRK